MHPDRPVVASQALPPRRWRPTTSVRISAALHATGIAAVAAFPEVWAVVAAALLGNHLALAGATLCPRSALLGANLVRLPSAAIARREVALTFDDGPDAVTTPRVLDLLDRYGAKASFFCIGERAAAHRDLVRELVRRGHSVENHSHRHSTSFGWYGVGRFRRELGAAQRVLTDIAGKPPEFFRAPFGVRSPLLDPALAQLGLRYVSWTHRGYDTVDGDATRVLHRLSAQLAAGDILMLHDGVVSGRATCAATVLSVLPRLLDRISAAGLSCVALPVACREPHAAGSSQAATDQASARV